MNYEDLKPGMVICFQKKNTFFVIGELPPERPERISVTCIEAGNFGPFIYKYEIYTTHSQFNDPWTEITPYVPANSLNKIYCRNRIKRILGNR